MFQVKHAKYHTAEVYLGALVPVPGDGLHGGGGLEAHDVDVLHALPALLLAVRSVALEAEAAQD